MVMHTSSCNEISLFVEGKKSNCLETDKLLSCWGEDCGAAGADVIDKFQQSITTPWKIKALWLEVQIM